MTKRKKNVRRGPLPSRAQLKKIKAFVLKDEDVEKEALRLYDLHRKEVAEFARTHPDLQTYAPLMAELRQGIPELDIAYDFAKIIHSATKEAIERNRRTRTKAAKHK